MTLVKEKCGEWTLVSYGRDWFGVRDADGAVVYGGTKIEAISQAMHVAAGGSPAYYLSDVQVASTTESGRPSARILIVSMTFGWLVATVGFNLLAWELPEWWEWVLLPCYWLFILSVREVIWQWCKWRARRETRH